MTRDTVNTVRGRVRGPVVQAGVIHGGVHQLPSRREWRHLFLTVVVLAASVAWWPERQPDSLDQPSLQVRQSVAGGCGRYLVDDRDPPTGRPVGYTPGRVVQIVVQNPSASEVVLMALRADLRKRNPPPSSGRLVLWAQCRHWTSDVVVRDLAVNLDVVSPLAVAADVDKSSAGYSLHVPKEAVPAKSFPYKVSRGDPEVLNVGFDSENCDCEFVLVLEATVAGRGIEVVMPEINRVVPAKEELFATK